MATFLDTIKAIITRLVFACHGLIGIWQVTIFKKNVFFWYLSSPLLLLFFEGIFTLTIKENQEWKWFCPSVFLYLASIVPSIWLLELDKVDKKVRTREEILNLTTNTENQLKQLNHFIGVQIELPQINLSTETWITLIEQFLMLILIIGRWMLPKGDLTRDQLSQILLVYIGTLLITIPAKISTVLEISVDKEKEVLRFFSPDPSYTGDLPVAEQLRVMQAHYHAQMARESSVFRKTVLCRWFTAPLVHSSMSYVSYVEVMSVSHAVADKEPGTAADIIEFFDSFKDDKVASEQMLVILTLSIWSWSLMQFTVVLTATKSRKSRMSSTEASKRIKSQCCNIDVWGIALNIVLQDAPFLAFRLLMIVHYLLQVYRLHVVHSENKRLMNTKDFELTSISIISKSNMSNYQTSKKPERTQSRRENLWKTNGRYVDRASGKSKPSRKDTGYSTESSYNSNKQKLRRESKTKGKGKDQRLWRTEKTSEVSYSDSSRSSDRNNIKTSKSRQKQKSPSSSSSTE